MGRSPTSGLLGRAPYGMDRPPVTPKDLSDDVTGLVACEEDVRRREFRRLGGSAHRIPLAVSTEPGVPSLATR